MKEPVWQTAVPLGDRWALPLVAQAVCLASLFSRGPAELKHPQGTVTPKAPGAEKGPQRSLLPTAPDPAVQRREGQEARRLFDFQTLTGQ